MAAGSSSCGATGIRTPDLLIANETRYQLRYSPLQADGTDSRPSNENSKVPPIGTRIGSPAATGSAAWPQRPQIQLGNHIRSCHASYGITDPTHTG